MKYKNVTRISQCLISVFLSGSLALSIAGVSDHRLVNVILNGDFDTSYPSTAEPGTDQLGSYWMNADGKVTPSGIAGKQNVLQLAEDKDMVYQKVQAYEYIEQGELGSAGYEGLSRGIVIAGAVALSAVGLEGRLVLQENANDIHAGSWGWTGSSRDGPDGPPPSSNRTSGFPASGLPTIFTGWLSKGATGSS
ncbi:MAG: hypothetical protein L3J30_07165, partial [Marinosulfonomonas sp.]|nr:hypothetical protein [Marinosulfonomonas sp.]